MKNDISKKYKGSINKFNDKKIYLNVNHLEQGVYTLNIVYKNKIIKKTKFNKNN